jgi:lauroyl/myristoyl acyltransferase
MKRHTTAITIQTGPLIYEGWIKPSDLITAGKLLCCAFAAVTPQRHWAAISRVFARVHRRLRGFRRERMAHACEQYLNADPAELELQVTAAEYEEKIEAIRDILPGGWQRPIVLRGSVSIEEARRQGRGAVLWVSLFAHSYIVTKRGLWLAGYRPNQLSHFGHPFSSSWLGARLLNPILLRAEDQYLERRVVVTYGQTRPALDILKQVLRDNGVVNLLAISAGRKAIALPLLGGTMRLALGAPYLALETGAALIPVYTVPDEAGGYAVHCGPDLNSDHAGAGSEVMRRMAERYVVLLETFVRAHPANWQGWFSLSWQPQPSKMTENAV